MEITQNEEGIIVNNKFCFTTKTEKQADYVTLGLICGEDVIYGTVQKNFINYPGEYQQDNLTIYCTMSKDNLLNFVVKGVNSTFAFVQDAAATKANAFEGVSDIVASNENTYNQLQKLDLQCNIIAL